MDTINDSLKDTIKLGKKRKNIDKFLGRKLTKKLTKKNLEIYQNKNIKCDKMQKKIKLRNLKYDKRYNQIWRSRSYL